MSQWMEVFIVVAACAIVVQAAILLLMYLTMRDARQRITDSITELRRKIEPVLARADALLVESEAGISVILKDTAAIAGLARGQAQKLDRVFTEATERLGAQVIRADQAVSDAMEAIEDTGVRIRKTVATPVMEVNAILKGVQAGLAILRGRRSSRSASGARANQDEELFI
jgi:hypothetical protein